MKKSVALLTVMVSGVLILSACSDKENKPSVNQEPEVNQVREEKTVSEGTKVDGVSALLSKEKTEEKKVTFTYSLKNDTKENKKYTFNSGKQYNYTLYKNGEKLYTQSEVMMYTQAMTEVDIPSGNQKDFSIDIIDLETGKYTLEVWFTPNEKENEYKQKIDFEVK